MYSLYNYIAHSENKKSDTTGKAETTAILKLVNK